MTGELDDDGAYATLQLGLLGHLADQLMKEHDILREFESLSHEELRLSLGKIDERLRKLHRAEIAHVAGQRRPPIGVKKGGVKNFTEMSLLRHEMGKKKRHLPIRKLIRRAGQSLMSLKPCFMMGPLSVAQYLEPGRIIFDLLIMDEASQLRPEDALGAIARARQVIVVGDPKQLPPTSFFDSLVNDDSETEDDELIVQGKESILDLLMPTLGYVRQLNWHYRSRHESLIAFSNRSFYDDRLLVFPSPMREGSDGELGVNYRYVAGEYAKQRNFEEAQELLRGVLREIRRSRGKRTVGVVAINSHQAELLNEEWNRLIREHPDLEILMNNWSEKNEPFFIKNLENVQGDERDVIFISLVYGRDRESGKVYQRFGPINQQNGWRRLNVLFTRARENMVVYSSMRSDEVLPNEGNRGATALRNFLAFCEQGGRLSPIADTKTGREPDSPFELEVIGAILQHGYQAVPQIGVAGFFIDIGVKHPDVKGNFILGIECDGKTYHSAKSARDRDHLRQEILESLGWRIHRIWSADWYKRRDRELRRLLEALEKAREFARENQENRKGSASFTIDSPFAGISSRVREIDSKGLVGAKSSTQKVSEEKVLPTQPDDMLESSLRRLKDTIQEEFPEVEEENNLLREDVIRLLVEHRPATKEAFISTIPLKLRECINPDQAKSYLGTVLSLCEGYS